MAIQIKELRSQVSTLSISEKLNPSITPLAQEVVCRTKEAYQKMKTSKEYNALNECTQCTNYLRWSEVERGTLGGGGQKIDKRYLFESALLSQIEKLHLIKDARITICSIGAGGCFQELVILTKLIEKRYNNIEIALIDPSYKNSNLLPSACEGTASSVKQLRDYIQNELRSDGAIQIYSYTSFDDYLSKLGNKGSSAPQVIMMMDMETTGNVLNDSIKLIQSSSQIPNESICAYTKSGQSIIIASKSSLHEIKEDRNFREQVIFNVKGRLAQPIPAQVYLANYCLPELQNRNTPSTISDSDSDTDD